MQGLEQLSHLETMVTTTRFHKVDGNHCLNNRKEVMHQKMEVMVSLKVGMVSSEVGTEDTWTIVVVAEGSRDSTIPSSQLARISEVHHQGVPSQVMLVLRV
jgi:hypothetical protein